MSDAKSTPGPWVRRGADTYRWQIETAGSPKTAIVVCRITTPSKGGIAASNANAALIAAAPDLADALEALLHVIGGASGPFAGTIAAARAALKKAEVGQ